MTSLGSLATNPDLDRWVGLVAGGRVVVRTGKVEFGQGIRTALVAIAADELGVHPRRIDLPTASTGESPEGTTAGSTSIEQGGMGVRQACAHARHILFERAARHLDVAVSALAVSDGTIRAADCREVSYWELTAGAPFGRSVIAPAKPPASVWRKTGWSTSSTPPAAAASRGRSACERREPGAARAITAGNGVH